MKQLMTVELIYSFCFLFHPLLRPFTDRKFFSVLLSVLEFKKTGVSMNSKKFVLITLSLLVSLSTHAFLGSVRVFTGSPHFQDSQKENHYKRQSIGITLSGLTILAFHQNIQRWHTYKHNHASNSPWLELFRKLGVLLLKNESNQIDFHFMPVSAAQADKIGLTEDEKIIFNDNDNRTLLQQTVESMSQELASNNNHDLSEQDVANAYQAVAVQSGLPAVLLSAGSKYASYYLNEIQAK